MPFVPKASDQGGMSEVEAGFVEDGISQEGHGFSVDDVVYSDSGMWTAADASTAALAGEGHRIGIVYAVGSADLLSVRFGGIHNSDAHGETVGAEVYLSETAGEFTTTAPSATNTIVLKLGTVRDADNFDMDIDTGYVNE